MSNNKNKRNNNKPTDNATHTHNAHTKQGTHTPVTHGQEKYTTVIRGQDKRKPVTHGEQHGQDKTPAICEQDKRTSAKRRYERTRNDDLRDFVVSFNENAKARQGNFLTITITIIAVSLPLFVYALTNISRKSAETKLANANRTVSSLISENEKLKQETERSRYSLDEIREYAAKVLGYEPYENSDVIRIRDEQLLSEVTPRKENPSLWDMIVNFFS
ncbi:MAG: hypothetical protein LBN42_03385 [Oscillospiraceae bacterium]|jgi:hypothetical protein|nr:hypothetical protein [Oscillospiraceae bacterium]